MENDLYILSVCSMWESNTLFATPDAREVSKIREYNHPLLDKQGLLPKLRLRDDTFRERFDCDIILYFHLKSTDIRCKMIHDILRNNISNDYSVWDFDNLLVSFLGHTGSAPWPQFL